MTKKALLFYISRFSGHYHAARSIERALQDLGDVEVKIVNAFDYTNPILGKIITKAYIEVVKKKPEFWGNIYDNPQVLERTRKARERFQKKGLPKIKKLMESFQPDIVYCTQAYPCGIVSGFKKETGDRTPLVGVLTDRAPHSYWLFDEVDIYVVPSEETKKVLAGKGIRPDKIRPYGIPIDPKFSKKFSNVNDKDEICREFGVPNDRRTVLVMGGNQGLGALEDILASFLKDDTHKYQVLLVTGNNKRLFRKLKRLIAGKDDGRFKLYPYVDNIDELMEISDLIITKAGGITTSEALAKGLPMFIVDPIPGQERMNSDYLVSEGAAMEIDNVADIVSITDSLFKSEDMFSKMKHNAERLSKSDSSMRIAELAMKGI